MESQLFKMSTFLNLYNLQIYQILFHCFVEMRDAIFFSKKTQNVIYVLLPDKDEEECLLCLPGDLLLLCFGGEGICLGEVLLLGDGCLLGLGRLLGEYDLDGDLCCCLGLV